LTQAILLCGPACPIGPCALPGRPMDFAAEAAARRRSVLEEARDPLGRHRWVRLVGLRTSELNGKLAEILVPPNEDDRLGVRVEGGSRRVLIKRANLQPIPDDETVRVCRLAAGGEHRFVGGYIQDTRWPLAKLETMPYDVSPVSTKLGFPLRVTRVEPRSELRERVAYDNQWATFLMIQTQSGIAADTWQSHVGPVVVWRPDGPVSSDDMCLFNDFLSGLLDQYSEGAVRVDRDLTPQAWASKKARILDDRQLNPHLQQYTDLNL